MNLDAKKIKERHDKFIKQACESGIVWVLEKNKEFATSFSGQYETEEGEPAELLCVWSEKEGALACAEEDWKEYTPHEITLADFIEKWCLGISDDGVMAGLNFDQSLIGSELDPLDLIIELSEELKNQKKTIKLGSYTKLDELVNEIKEVLGL